MTCESLRAAVGSLAATFSASAEAIEDVVRSIGRPEIDRSDDPAAALPRLVAERVGREAAGVTKIRYFHGTRVCEPDSFHRNGLLPLGARLDDIWSELTKVGAGVLSGRQFGDLRAAIDSGGGGDGGRQYRTKVTDALHHGPFGEYVREHYFRPGELSSHDYLRTPEIIEDIALAACDFYGVDLLAAYSAATRPCIVTFDIPVRDAQDAVRAIAAACWYVWSAARDEVTRDACGGFDGRGVPVPPDAVRAVTFVER